MYTFLLIDRNLNKIIRVTTYYCSIYLKDLYIELE